MLLVYSGEDNTQLGLYAGGIYDIKNVYTLRSGYVHGSVCGQTNGSYYKQINLGTVKEFRKRWKTYVSSREEMDRLVTNKYKREMKKEKDAVENMYLLVQETVKDTRTLSLIETMLLRMRIYGNYELAIKRNVNV